jgi:general secretion pathway protein I
VLVALVVIAVAMAALARIGSQSVDSQFEIEQRSFALWVADNLIAEMRLDPPAARPGARA